MTRDTLNVTDFTKYWLEQAFDADSARDLFGLANFEDDGVSLYYGFDANGVLGMHALPAIGAVPTGTGFRHVTAGVEDGAAQLVSNADVDVAAAIVESKLSLSFGTSGLNTRITTLENRNIDTQHSLTGGGDLSADRTLNLVNDSAAPGNNMVYGTDGAGVRGWKADPSGGVSDGDKSDITVSGGGTVWTIDNDVVTYAKMQNVSATDRLLGRSSVGAGDVEEITCTAAGRALLDDATAGDQRTTLGLGALAVLSTVGTTEIDNSAVTLSKMADLATARFIGRVTAGTGVPEALTGTQATTLLDAFTSALKGLVPASGGGTANFLRADGVFAAPTAADATGYTTIVKAANQDVTNAGVTNDNDFSFAVTAGAHYMVTMDLTVSANNTTGDYIADFQVSAGTMTGKGTCQNLTAAAAVQNIIITAAAAANTTAIVTGAPSANLDDLVAVRMFYSFTASANATFRYRFGNSAASGGRTSRTWKGSIMQWKTLD